MENTQGVLPERVPYRRLELPIGDCIRRGWDLALQNLGPFIGYTCLVIAIHVALAFIPILGWVAGIVINPALSAGYFIYIRKKIRGEQAEFQDFFGGFDYLGQLFILGLVSGFLIFIGTLLCIIPGLYLMVGYMFSSFLVVARRLDFWPAMETSRRAVTDNLGSMIIFLLALIGINILGAVACLVGLIITVPLSYCATVVAFHMIFEETDVAATSAAASTPGPIHI
jgi:uncharacterized membrane protein